MRIAAATRDAAARLEPGVRGAAALTGFAAVLALVYHDVVAKLVHDWIADDNYSHGFLIVPVSLYVAWERRGQLRPASCTPSALGLLVVLGSLAIYVAGVLGAELFLTRISLIGVLAGTVLFVLGWSHLRLLAFPLALLLLTIPIPAIVFNQIAFPLQLLASRFGETVLAASAIPVLREGNLIVTANTTMEVAEACSGIRSLISLLTLAILYGYFTDPRAWVRLTSACLTIPIAIVANGLRVAGTGLVAHRYGSAAAEGFFHTFSGWLVFLAAVAMLSVSMRAVTWLAPMPGLMERTR